MPLQTITKTLPTAIIEQLSPEQKSDVPRLDSSYDIQALTKIEKQKLKKLDELEDVSLNELEIDGEMLYVVIYKYRSGCCTFSTVRLVYYRSKEKTQAKQIFDITKYNVNKVMKGIGKKGQKQESALLKDVVSLTIKNKTWKPSHIAAQMNWPQMFEKSKSIIITDSNKEPTKTCLHIALIKQNLATVRAILALKPDLSNVDENGDTAVHYAAMTTLEIFKAVIASPGAKELLRKKNKKGCTPLHLACFSNKPDIVLEFFKLQLTVADLTALPPTTDSTKYKEEASDNKVVPIFTYRLIEDLELRDIVYGGNPLHWTTTRRSMEILLNMGFSVNAKNMAEETPLYMQVKRRRIKCVVVLLCNDNIDLEIKNNEGYTPLHEAVRQRDIPMVQTLLVFDANVNAKNNYNETPRHLVAKGKTRRSSAEDIILYALHLMKAKRCSSTMKECSIGCAFNKQYNGKPYAQWSNFKEEPLYKRILLENCVKNAISEKKQSNETTDRNAKKRVAMICFDGGGVRGLISAQILIELQTYFEKPLIDHFRWVVGTSTGALLSSLLCTKSTPKDIRKIYFTFKNRIMKGSKPYSSVELENALKSHVDEEIAMSDVKDKKLVIAATLADRHPAQLHLFRSYESQIAKIMGETEKQFMKSLPDHHNMKLWAACRASASAPVYFNPYGPYIDGGVIANNPTLDALAEFTLHNELLKFTGHEDEVEELMLVVSVGTGKIPVVIKDPINNVAKMFAWNPADAYRNAIVVRDLLVMILDQATGTDAHVVHRAQTWCHGIGVPYFRLNPPMSNALALDCIEDEELINVMWETKAYMYSVRSQLCELVQLLALDGEKIKLPKKTKKGESEEKEETVAPAEKEKKEILKDFRNDYKVQDTLLQ
ncbi:85/88 kDa calcium-independent phospholipase A2-like protein [Leptotrombidium deliense]|uniref:phospholipase A2 n=1 Tax=Leptotrombidium deliense TaxID=299467 RepID=A0A443SF90_9ACAR|nr:85/88 kDa calcium-independent phospholipase A2-like protein [Leptotrombidium deliense]